MASTLCPITAASALSMNTIDQTPSRHSRVARAILVRSAGLVVSATLIAGLVACDPKEDTAGNIIKAAQLKLSELAPSSINPLLTHEEQISQFSSVAQTLQQVASSGSTAQKNAANILIARAHLAAGEPHAQQATELERQMLDMASEIRGYAATWEQQSSRAETLSSYDPTKELATIDTELKEAMQRTADRNERLAELKSELQQVEAQVQLALQRAKDERQTEATLIGQSNRASGQTALDYFEQATTHRRNADLLEQQAGGLSAKAEALTPQVDQIVIEIDSLGSLREQLNQAKEAVRKRQESSRSQAAEARELANAAQSQIKSLVGQVQAIRTSDLPSTVEAAIESYEAGLQAATAATSDKNLRTEATMIKGRTSHGIGSLYLAREAALEPLESLMVKLNAVRPELDDITNYSLYAQQIEQNRNTYKQQALTALEEAYLAFGSVTGGQQFQDSVGKLRTDLAGFASSYSGGALNLSSPDFNTNDTGSDEGGEYTPATSAASADQTTPQGTMDMLFNAARAKNFTAIGTIIHTDDPAMRDMVSTITSAATAGFGLSDALQREFGVNLIDAIKQASESEAGMSNQYLMMAAGGLAAINSGGMGESNPAEEFQTMLRLTSADLEFDEQGDSCSVSYPAKPDEKPMILTNFDGMWYLNLDTMMAADGENAQQIEQGRMMMQMVMPFVQPVTDALSTVQSNVESGSYDSSDDAVLGLIAELEPMLQNLQSMMGGMMGGGGGFGGGE
ncbi:MAG: hypothetical protein H6815_07745 [Phycisphaeraceae bacterium]|nr:hypothetical protein [Phycisphaerales bacterium]MCB9860334.1 hypothetical protein [Phycisphaeraceae bacterium]